MSTVSPPMHFAFFVIYYFGEVKTDVRQEGYHTLSHNICYPHPISPVPQYNNVCDFFVGSLKGVFQWQAHEGKVFSLHWTTLNENNLLLSCGPDGKMVRF